MSSELSQFPQRHEIVGKTYPSLDDMTRELRELANSEERIQVSAYASATRMDSVNQHDLRWFRGRGDESDPITRTENYLVAVQKCVDRLLDASGVVHLPANQLPDHFGNLHIGTPFSKHSIGISTHPDGYTVTEFGDIYDQIDLQQPSRGRPSHRLTHRSDD